MVHSTYTYYKTGRYVLIEAYGDSYYYDEESKRASFICDISGVYNGSRHIKTQKLYTDGKDFYASPTSKKPIYSDMYEKK